MYVESGPLPESSKALPRLQAILYHGIMAPCAPMPKQSQNRIAIALDAFAQNVAGIKADKQIPNDTELWLMVGKHSKHSPAQKTVNNTVKGRHDAKISNLEAIADGLNVPLWVLFVPGLEEAGLLKSPHRERFMALVDNYIKCKDDGRTHTEGMAAAFAAKAKTP